MRDKIGIILGSGLNKFTEELSSPALLYRDEDSFHKIEILSGNISGREIILFSGRKHFYESYPAEKVLYSVNKAAELGIKLLVVTNAAGGLNRNFKVSDLMLITSHINFLNKLIPVSGNKIYYPPEIISKLKSISKKKKIELRFGSYCSNNGPNYETRAEIRFLSKFGIDAVGMSTIPEVLYAGKLGIKTIAISCITNILSEQSSGQTNHEEVLEAGKNSYENFSGLLKSIIEHF